MHFVDHVDLVARIGGRIHRALQKRCHLFDRTVRGRIDFNVVDKASFIDCAARLAFAARVTGHTPFAVLARAIKALGKNARERGFADAARAGK